jgi:hypothetical protein
MTCCCETLFSIIDRRRPETGEGRLVGHCNQASFQMIQTSILCSSHLLYIKT